MLIAIFLKASDEHDFTVLFLDIYINCANLHDNTLWIIYFTRGDFDADFNFPNFRIYSFDSWYVACLSAGKIISKATP